MASTIVPIYDSSPQWAPESARRCHAARAALLAKVLDQWGDAIIAEARKVKGRGHGRGRMERDSVYKCLYLLVSYDAFSGDAAMKTGKEGDRQFDEAMGLHPTCVDLRQPYPTLLRKHAMGAIFFIAWTMGLWSITDWKDFTDQQLDEMEAIAKAIQGAIDKARAV